LYPLKLLPAFKDYIWGGTKLKTDFNKFSNLDKVAESWELSCHKDGESIISNGDFKGMSLSKYIEQNGREILGENCKKFDDFPILIKLIDAKDNLSVQVHPDNEYALKVRANTGKPRCGILSIVKRTQALFMDLKRKFQRKNFLKE